MVTWMVLTLVSAVMAGGVIGSCVRDVRVNGAATPTVVIGVLAGLITALAVLTLATLGLLVVLGEMLDVADLFRLHQART